jgi:hypothetical protein
MTTQQDQMFADNIYPMTFWNYCDMDVLLAKRGPTWKDVVKDWTDSGMTLAMTPRFNPETCKVDDMRELLDECAEANLKAILWDNRCQYWSGTWNDGEDGFRRGVEASLKDFGDHPAVFGHQGGDEPHGEWIQRAYDTSRILKEMAPQWSPFMNLGPYSHGVNDWMGVQSYSDYLDGFCQQGNCDYLCFDVYWQMLPDGGGLDLYFTCLKMFADAAKRNNKPWWATLLSVGHYEYRCPSEDDFRWQINTAAALGCKGLAWFFMYMREPHDNYRVSPIDEHWERTHTFDWMSRQNRLFCNSVGPRLAQLDFQRAWFVGETYGGWPGDKIDSRLVKGAQAKYPVILSEFKDAAGNNYLCVVNNSQTVSGQAVVTVQGKPKLHRVGWESKDSEARLWFDDANPSNPATIVGPWLAPGQMELYRLEHDQPTQPAPTSEGEWPAYKAADDAKDD